MKKMYIMIKKTVISIFILIIYLISSEVKNATGHMQLFDNTNVIVATKKKLVVYDPGIKKFVKGHGIFLSAIGKMESNNKYDIINKYGYMGRYQFGITTLKGLNIDTLLVSDADSIYTNTDSIIKTRFIKDTLIQEIAMHRYLKYNKRHLTDYISQYDKTYIDSIYVTTSGILAAAHLSGSTNVKRFFDSMGEKNCEDAFGTSIKDYLKNFSGYNLNIY